MHSLIVVSHPQSGSLSHAVAGEIAAAAVESGGTAEIADLSAEDFDPRFTLADLAVHREKALPPADVRAEQDRIDRADDLVLVFPVYWWSTPGLLKGWIDRVFANGWAFDFGPDTGLVKRLGRLRVHLLGVAGMDTGTYTRRGYDTAMTTQIDRGVFDYCGAEVVTSKLLTESETRDPAAHLATARELGNRLGAMAPAA